MGEIPAQQNNAPRYDTYLLTCWQERDEVAGTVIWRFKLETPRSGRWRVWEGALNPSYSPRPASRFRRH